MMRPLQQLTHKLKHAKVLLVTDVDETLTHKQADVVRLNQGALSFLGAKETHIPYETPLPSDAQVTVFSTGRTLEVALNWLAELGKEIFTLRSPDVLLCNNGQTAYLNTHNALTWGNFMQDLQEPQKRSNFSFTAYDTALLKHYTHDVSDTTQIPLSGLVREQLLRHYMILFNELAQGSLQIENLDLLTVESFTKATPSSPETMHGFERMIKVMRDQAQMEVTHGFHLPVKVHITDDTTNTQKTLVEHLIVAFFGEGDPKPLIQSMGCTEWHASKKEHYLWEEALETWEGTDAVASLETLIPHNLRSTFNNSSTDALATLVSFLKKEAQQAFKAYLEQDLSVSPATQTKHMESPIARQKSDSPRSYILINGLLDKGKSVVYLYDALIDLAESLGIQDFSQQLEALITLGDGSVDKAMLSIQPLKAMFHREAIAVPNHAVVVHNGAKLEKPQESALWRQVHKVNPSVRYVDGFFPEIGRLQKKHLT